MMSAFANWFSRGTGYSQIYFPGHPVPTEADIANDQAWRAFLARNQQGFFDGGYTVTNGELGIDPNYAGDLAVNLPGAVTPSAVDTFLSEAADGFGAAGSDAASVAIPSIVFVGLAFAALVAFKIIK